MHRHSVLPTLLVVLTSAACTATGDTREADGDTLPTGQVLVEVGSAQVRAEVADDPEERAVGLMRRAGVAPGTGMVFLFGGPTDARFYMYDVQVPLTAVFARDGRVVGVVQMPPCGEQQPQACPRYGPGAPYDTVLEASPATLRGVREGDRLVVGAGAQGWLHSRGDAGGRGPPACHRLPAPRQGRGRGAPGRRCPRAPDRARTTRCALRPPEPGEP